MKHEQLIIFDFDDTLVNTSDKYWQARTHFVQLMTDEGFDPTLVVEEFENVDSALMKIFHYSPYRYGKSMLITYHKFIDEFGLYPSKDVLLRLKACGSFILENLPDPIDGAKDLLEWASNNFTLVLLTRGDPLFQKKKIAYAGFTNLFSLTYIVNKKDIEEFIYVIKKMNYTPEKTWIIGDSITHEINHAIKLGANSILFAYHHPFYKWRQEYSDVFIGSFYKTSNLSEIKEILFARRKLTH